MSDILKRTRAYLADPKHWTKGVLFGDKHGHNVRRPDAECACLVGAMTIAEPFNAVARREAYELLLAELAKPSGSIGSLTTFNDDPATTHADVLALLDKVIQNGN